MDPHPIIAQIVKTRYIAIVIRRLLNLSSVPLNLKPHCEQKRTVSEVCSCPHFVQNIETPPMYIRHQVTTSSLLVISKPRPSGLARRRESTQASPDQPVSTICGIGWASL